MLGEKREFKENGHALENLTYCFNSAVSEYQCQSLSFIGIIFVIAEYKY